MDPITIFVCGGGGHSLEELHFAAITGAHEREMDDQQRAEDRCLRLTEGACDLCQQPADEPLVELGDEALCRECCDALHGGGAYGEAVDFGAPADHDVLDDDGEAR